MLMGTVANTEDVGPIQETAEENKTQHNTKRNIRYQVMKKNKILSKNHKKKTKGTNLNKNLPTHRE